MKTSFEQVGQRTQAKAQQQPAKRAAGVANGSARAEKEAVREPAAR
jgi:hypothetical protein